MNTVRNYATYNVLIPFLDFNEICTYAIIHRRKMGITVKLLPVHVSTIPMILNRIHNQNNGR